MATRYDGRMNKTKNQIFFIDEVSHQSYSVTGSTPIISTYLNKLSPGDFISIEGSLNINLTILTINSVNYIGLKALLGTWTGDDLYCYNFSSFTEFSISHFGQGKKCFPADAPSYTYFVNPTTSSWVMLLAGDRGSYVGELKINNPKDIEIELYDSETGDILRSIHLRK